MNNQSEYFKITSRKFISAISIITILLVNSSLVTAKEATVEQTAQNQTEHAVKQQVVNLNKSTFDQLVTLKGIGHNRAQAIIVYRQQVGGFKSVNELSEVSGIGEKIVSDNRARLSL